MMRRVTVSAALFGSVYVVSASVPGAPAQSPSTVTITHDTVNAQYAVTVGGRRFTRYRYGAEFAEKPVFHPVNAPNGARVNREYPMVPGLPGETADHPHHQSMFFTYDEVNGTNFWNPDKANIGRRVEHLGAEVQGNTLVARLAWKDKDGRVVLDELKRVTFGGDSDVFWMDHDLTLIASNGPVTMGDTKEGMFAIRLNDTLKEAGGSGRYINAEGLETAASVWGKRSAWVAIRGTVADAVQTRPVTVAIFAHADGARFPPFWHARDYGLFSANPLGQHAFDPALPENITRLAQGDQLRLRFRLAVYDGEVSKARLDRDYAGLD